VDGTWTSTGHWILGLQVFVSDCGFQSRFQWTIHCGCLLQQLQDQTVSGKELLDAVGDDFRAKINGTDTWDNCIKAKQ
jgi:hypothetical protein